jgi:hypothetical protein
MYTLPAKPQPIGVVLDDAIELYRNSFRSCWPISLVGTVVVTGLRLRADTRIPNVTYSGQTARELFTQISQSMQHTNSGLSTLLVLLVELLIYGGLFAQIHYLAMHGRTQSTRDGLVLALRRLPGMILASIIWSVAVGIGMVLLLLPGIYLWGKLEFWVVAAFADDVGSIGGLGRSWEITQGNWWRSVTALTVALIVLAVFGAGADALAGVAYGLGFTHDLTTLLLIAQVIQGVVAIFVLPILPAVALSVYYDMKLRRDGADLLGRAKSLQTA